MLRCIQHEYTVQLRQLLQAELHCFALHSSCMRSTHIIFVKGHLAQTKIAGSVRSRCRPMLRAPPSTQHTSCLWAPSPQKCFAFSVLRQRLFFFFFFSKDQNWSVCEACRFLSFRFSVFHRTDTHIKVLSVALALSINNKQTNKSQDKDFGGKFGGPVPRVTQCIRVV